MLRSPSIQISWNFDVILRYSYHSLRIISSRASSFYPFLLCMLCYRQIESYFDSCNRWFAHFKPSNVFHQKESRHSTLTLVTWFKTSVWNLEPGKGMPSCQRESCDNKRVPSQHQDINGSINQPESESNKKNQNEQCFIIPRSGNQNLKGSVRRRRCTEREMHAVMMMRWHEKEGE